VKTGLVLSGGGARGAYEVGVLRYLREALPLALGEQPRLEILSGTSIGAVNACFMAATAESPEDQAARLSDVWLSLRLDDVFRWGALALSGLPAYVWRRLRALRARRPDWRISDLVNPDALARAVRDRIDWGQLHENLRSGRIEALTVTATDLGTGRSVVFVEAPRPLPGWSRDPLVEVRASPIGPEHALASSAIPLLFPPVRIDGGWFTDGSVRQTTPLAPALRLGADRVLVVGLRHEVHGPPPPIQEDGEPTTFEQIGRLLSALLLDRTDYDIDRMRRLNTLLDQGERIFGAGFAERMTALSERELGTPLRRVRDLVLRPSIDLAAVAREHARAHLERLPRGSVAARLLRRAAEDGVGAADGAADLASYLLFDREYAGELMALGYQDTARRQEELLAFFAPTVGEARSARG
jgi:NTE family protein